jgi:hypothetical protein
LLSKQDNHLSAGCLAAITLERGEEVIGHHRAGVRQGGMVFRWTGSKQGYSVARLAASLAAQLTCCYQVI